jgi:HD-GYP domain-containing protein (c-di-GMP phosphodiesterase class II)
MEAKEINSLLVNIIAAFRNVQLYAPEHPLVAKSVTKAVEALNDFFKKANTFNSEHPRFETLDELTFMVIENELVIKGLQVTKLATASLNLAKMLKSKGIERLTLKAGLDKDELTRFISSFVRIKGIDSIKASEHITIGKVKLKAKDYDEGEETGETDAEMEPEEGYELVRREDYSRIQEMYYSAKKHKKLNIVGIESIVGQFMSTFKKELSPLLSMASLKSFDEYTYVHAANVCILTMAQAESLGLEDEALHDIGVAAMVHDVGKTFVPDEILNKQGKLTDEEWKVMHSHPAQGAKYLSNMPGVSHLAVIIAFEHHMKGDLTGYPKVGDGYKLHPCSQITNIADVFDALSTIRPYRKPMPRDKIFSILREGSGTEFDPILLENFISMIEGSEKAPV